MDTIYCKDFPITPSIRNNIQNSINKIKYFIKGVRSTKVSLSKEGHNEFKIQLEVIYFGKNILVETVDQDLYKGVRNAKTKAIRQIIEVKNKKNSSKYGRSTGKFYDEINEICQPQTEC